jgi:hypothetical protein
MESGTTGSSQTARRGWTLFHVVSSLNPPLEDFQSMLGGGRIPRPRRDGQYNPEMLRRAAGVSCYQTRDQARVASLQYRLGGFIAELFIPEDGCAIEVARTGTADGHYTVWASTAYFVSHVVSVQPL